MTTPYQLAKLERVFKMKDHTGDGKVTVEDFIQWGGKVAMLSGIEFTKELQERWEKAFAAFFANGVGKSMEEWIKSVVEFGKMENVLEISAGVNLLLFDCVDVDHDGSVSLKEYVNFVKPLGVTEDDAKLSFNMIDADGDGTLSKEELSVACAHYYFDTDETKYAHFYGKFDHATL
eukprot:CAMPEP_0198138294 /NCGR_PEP_ID=MMETSP1443-20131203/1704_1 /TAXON_ID=186043 /ORGANISM="Entomoneis sp., Strain CCMP2396" /LENGTH=175 /DNA_ID=CAMNT_0043800005 /DNA_START=100 /DNA_END=627 /DNA_ORIENTATION=+